MVIMENPANKMDENWGPHPAMTQETTASVALLENPQLP
jgi:hypothetical protein